MDKTSDQEIKAFLRAFLKEFKTGILAGNLRVQDNNVKNREGLISLGITGKQREQELLALSEEDWYAGPKEDVYIRGVYWEFLRDVNNKETYIKIRLIEAPNGDEYAMCYSFHPSGEY